jgi:epoxyqueuosine reductase
MPARLKAFLRSLGWRVKSGSGTSDRWAAARAGVARLGRNTFAYAEGCGSWINIECWRVDAALPPDPPTLDDPCPPGCRRCLQACPTGALCRAREIRIERCVAWLTYAAPWPVAPDLWRRMGKWIYGCDACQDVCPLNEGAGEEREPMPWLAVSAPYWQPERLAEMSDAEYREHVLPFFWYIPPDGAGRWRANARRSQAAG